MDRYGHLEEVKTCQERINDRLRKKVNYSTLDEPIKLESAKVSQDGGDAG